MAKRWYVLQVFSGYESQVKRSLEEHIRNAGMQDEFGDILVPTEEVMEMRGGQQRRSMRKFFPGYVLIQMERSDRDPNDPDAKQNTEADKRRWHLINSVPRVISFVGGKADNPAPIPQSQVDKILSRMQEGVEQPRPKILYEPGEIVRIKEGPFVDFSGVVEAVDYEKNRLKVSVLIFGRSTSVDLEFSQIEKE